MKLSALVGKQIWGGARRLRPGSSPQPGLAQTGTVEPGSEIPGKMDYNVQSQENSRPKAEAHHRGLSYGGHSYAADQEIYEPPAASGATSSIAEIGYGVVAKLLDTAEVSKVCAFSMFGVHFKATPPSPLDLLSRPSIGERPSVSLSAASWPDVGR
jgi:hypothetical protein